MVPIYVFLFSLGAYYLLAFSFDFLPAFHAHVDSLTMSLPKKSEIVSLLPMLIISLVLLLLAVKEYIVTLSKAPITKRKVMSLLIWQFVLSFVAAFFYDLAPEFFVFGLIALALIFTNYFQYIKKMWVKEIWIWLLVLLAFLPVIVEI